MVGRYDTGLLALSIFIALFASFVALDLSMRVAVARGRNNAWFRIIGSAISIGTGIVSLNLIGLLAYSPPIPLSFNIPIMLGSLLVAMLAPGLALYTASHAELTWPRLGICGGVMGAGIAGMHYLGMEAVRLQPHIEYDPRYFFVSIVVAVGASSAAIWIAFQSRRLPFVSVFWRKFVSALIMGGAIAGTHYVGMAAAIISDKSIDAAGPQLIDRTWLAVTIAGIAFLFLGTTLMISLYGSMQRTIRSRLIFLVVSCALPVSLMAITFVLYDYHRAKAQQVTNAVATARATMAMIDKDIASVESGVLVLATSRSLIVDDFPKFYSQAQEVLRDLHASAITLSDADGELLIDTRRPFGESLPLYEHPAMARRVFETGLPVISDFFVDKLDRESLITVGAPVWRASTVHFVISASVSSNRLSRLLMQQVLPPEWIVAVFDSTGTIVARSHELPRFVGKKGASVLLKRLTQVGEGAIEVTTLEGIPVVAAFSRSPTSKWTVAIGIPTKSLTGNLVVSLWWLLLAIATLLTISLGLAWKIGYSVTRSIQALAQPSPAVGGPIQSAYMSFKEADDVATELLQHRLHLERLVDDRTEELRIVATAFDSQEPMLITDDQSVILRVNRAFTASTGYTSEEVVGQTPRLLKSDRHDGYFYAAMWESIRNRGAWHGEIWNRSKNGDEHPYWITITAIKGADGTVSNYVSTQTDITSRKNAEEEIRQLAFYDTLTNLPNRRLLIDRLQQALATSARSGREGALMFIDLDNFKNLNDTLGHDMGDLLLQQVATRLCASVRDVDTVARLGGDEFVVMLEELSASPEKATVQATEIGEKILAALNRPYDLANNPYHSTPSIGVTLFAGHKINMTDLLKQADLAMYQAKAAGRNTLCFFDPEKQAIVNAHIELVADFKHGLACNAFLLYYQAQVDRAGLVTGAEALVRWQHPVRGMVSPLEFIPLAEDTGLILPLGNWVLETACAQLVAWSARTDTNRLTVAVNVSAVQFRRQDFVLQVMRILDQSGADPRKLKLEITESLLLHDVEDIIQKMTALQSRGVSFSLDDFGTGYSSLAYLKRLPIDQLKIDRSFVRDVMTDNNDATIAKTIIALGQNLGLAVIAEGVETEEQREFLAKHNCHAYQGFLFGRPLPLQEFEQFIH